MLKSLLPIEFSDMFMDRQYVMLIQEYERFGDSASIVYVGKGSDIIEDLKSRFYYDEDQGSVEEWLLELQESNGDGDDYVEVYEL